MKQMLALAIASTCVSTALANDVLVQIHGFVWGNQINQGALDPVMPGETATIAFELDSGNFQNSPNYNTRGYLIDESTFTLSFSGGVSVGLRNPYIDGTPMFVVRESDPVADGFMISNNTDWPVALDTTEVGRFGNFAVRFNVSYEGTTLSTLNILDAAGTYDYTGLTVFGMGVNDGFIEDVMGMDFTSMSVTVIPAPASVCMLAGAALLGVRRRR